MSKHAPIIYKDKTHRPAVPGEQVDSAFVQISAREGNTIQAISDGLYVGAKTEGDTLYVASTGVDAPSSGIKAVPFKTLDYCLQFIKNREPLAAISNSIRIALKAGEAFDMTTTVDNAGYMMFTFFGDPNYGDFDSPYVGGIAHPAVMSDLQRPVINVKTIAETSDVIMHGVRLLDSGTVSLIGVRLELPDFGPGTPPTDAGTHFGDYSDFAVAVSGSAGQLEMFGTIVNKANATSPFGLFGVHARCTDARLTQFATQLWFGGQKIDASNAGTSALAVRKWFIKFYKDYFGNRQSNGFMNAGSAGSGLLSVCWSESQSMTVIPGKVSLETYPVASEQVYGLGNYFMNIARDNQGRALNVFCGHKL